jgi:hypothetical protein
MRSGDVALRSSHGPDGIKSDEGTIDRGSTGRIASLLQAVISTAKETNMNGNRIAAAVFLWLVAGMLGTGCAGLSTELKSLDPSTLKPNEGVIVVRFLTSRADPDDLAHPHDDPDLSYSVSMGTHKGFFLQPAGYEDSLDVDAKHGPVLIALGLEAGDHYFNTIDDGQRTAHIAVRFSVQPGRVTYIGDLQVMFIEKQGLHLSTTMKCNLKVSTDAPAMMNQLNARFPSVPTVETVPMVLENVSL